VLIVLRGENAVTAKRAGVNNTVGGEEEEAATESLPAQVAATRKEGRAFFIAARLNNAWLKLHSSARIDPGICAGQVRRGEASQWNIARRNCMGNSPIGMTGPKCGSRT
jgi:hypothetical protein